MSKKEEADLIPRLGVVTDHLSDQPKVVTYFMSEALLLGSEIPTEELNPHIDGFGKDFATDAKDVAVSE